MSTALKQCKHILIVGVHQFEGFHICSKLVEEGLLVDGVVIVPKNPLQKKICEEEMMWLGRNAHFHLLEEDSWIEDASKKQYDLIYYCQTDHQPIDDEAEKHRLEKTVEIASLKQTPIIFIFSLEGENPLEDRDEEIDSWMQQIGQKWTFPYLFVYLPTVFGPWQPLGHWISNSLLECTGISRSKTNANEKIVIRDILHIDEIVPVLTEFDEDLFAKKTIYLISDDKERIKKVMSFFDIFHYIYKPISKSEHHLVVPKTVENIEKSLQELKDFFLQNTRRLYT